MAGGRTEWLRMGIRTTRRTVTVDETDEKDGQVEREAGLLQAMEHSREEEGFQVVQDVGVMGEESRCGEDATGRQVEVQESVQMQGIDGDWVEACGSDRGDDGSDGGNRAKQGAAEMQVSGGACAHGAGVVDAEQKGARETVDAEGIVRVKDQRREGSMQLLEVQLINGRCSWVC